MKGRPSPASWRFEADVCVPDVDGLRMRLWDSVCLLTCAVDAARPWKGMGPVEVAAQTGPLLGALESSPANESSTPTGFLLPVPQGADADHEDDPLAAMQSDLTSLGGNLALVETTTGFGGGPGRGTSEGLDTVPARTGTTGGILYASRGLGPSVLAACGTPPSLFLDAGGTP